MEASDATDEQLWRVCRRLPSDFEPHGPREREGTRKDNPDCGTCRFFQPLLRPGELDWGACANPASPRADLLTFREQGCGQFEIEQEPGTQETRRSRSEFKNRIEDFVREAFAAFTKGEVAKANGIPKEKEFLAWHWEEAIEMALDLHIYHLFEDATKTSTAAWPPRR